MLVVHRAIDIGARITRRMDLWERGLHTGMLGDAEMEGEAREGRSASGGEEEKESVARSYHDTLLSGKMSEAVRWVTDREGGGFLLPDEQCTKTRRLVAEVLWDKYSYTQVPPVENPAYAAFEEYEEVPETVPLDFTEDDITWVVL